MKIKSVLLGVGSLVLVASGAYFLSQIPVDAILAKEADFELQPQVLTALDLEVIEVVDEEAALIVNETVPSKNEVEEVELPTALLTVIEEEVFLFDFVKEEHVLIEEETELVEEGDCIRTGKEGLAEIEFATDITLNLEPNTEVCILTFSPEEDVDDNEEVMNLYLSLSVGQVFFQNNNEEEKWDVKIVTPTTLTYSDDDTYSFEVSTIFPGTELLEPEDMEEFIKKTIALTPKEVCEYEDGKLYLCDDCATCSLLIYNNPMKTIVVDKTGEVKVIYLSPPTGFETAVLFPSEMFIFEFDGYEEEELWALLCSTLGDIAKGEEIDDGDIGKLVDPFEKPLPTPIVTPVSPCGDGVCDIYGGENATNCPTDCD